MLKTVDPAKIKIPFEKQYAVTRGQALLDAVRKGDGQAVDNVLKGIDPISFNINDGNKAVDFLTAVRGKYSAKLEGMGQLKSVDDKIKALREEIYSMQAQKFAAR